MLTITEEAAGRGKARKSHMPDGSSMRADHRDEEGRGGGSGFGGGATLFQDVLLLLFIIVDKPTIG